MRCWGDIRANCVTLFKLPANVPDLFDADSGLQMAHCVKPAFLQCINLVTTLTFSEAVIGSHSCSFTFDGEEALGQSLPHASYRVSCIGELNPRIANGLFLVPLIGYARPYQLKDQTPLPQSQALKSAAALKSMRAQGLGGNWPGAVLASVPGTE